MQGRKRLLGFRLGCHKSHGRARSGFTDCLGVHEVILVALDDRTHELGRDQFDILSKRRQLASHVVRTGTGFHDDGARLQSSDELDQSLATYRPAEHGFAMPSLSMKVKSAYPDQSQPAWLLP